MIPPTDDVAPVPPPGPDRRPSTPLRPVNLPARWRRHTEPRWAFTGLVIAAPLTLLVLAFGWSSVRAADTTTRSRPVGQLDYGVQLDYRFVVDPSPVYPTGTIGTKRDATGLAVPTDPLYVKLLHRLEVALDFEANGSGVSDLQGTYQAEVTVSVPEGWTTSVATIAPHPVKGSAVEALTIDFDDVTRRVQEVALLTGVGGGQFTLVVAPRLEVEGSAGGVRVHEISAPEQTFVVTNGVVKAQPVRSASTSKRLTHDVHQHARYRIGLLSLDIRTAREMAGGLALVVLAAAAWFASVLFGGMGLGESDRIKARYRSQLVDVSAATAPPGPVVMVGAIEELARLARVEQTVILHEDLGDGGHRYRVFLGTVTYEYETAPEHGGSALDEDALESVAGVDTTTDLPEG